MKVADPLRVAGLSRHLKVSTEAAAARAALLALPQQADRSRTNGDARRRPAVADDKPRSRFRTPERFMSFAGYASPPLSVSAAGAAESSAGPGSGMLPTFLR